MSKNGIKIYKSSKSINSFRKKSSTENINNQIINFANKYASSSSNNIGDTVGDISKCLTSGSNFKTPKKTKKIKKDINKKKRKSRDIFRLMKNKEKIKIPTGKRFSNVNSSSKLNLNNINIFETEKPPTKETKARKDKNGIEINKFNKKKVHITFLDNISPNNKITETIIIQSYKNYNLFDNIPNEENINKCGVCCNIF
jgi:hypothetical protein